MWPRLAVHAGSESGVLFVRVCGEFASTRWKDAALRIYAARQYPQRHRSTSCKPDPRFQSTMPVTLCWKTDVWKM
jgi:hypothetical protein